MRIIAGTLNGRRLVAVPGDRVRPTSDSLRETLFNVLGPTVAGSRVLDAFAGTGALGLEAISRGATHVTFVDADPRALKVITTNVAHCGVENACAIIRGDFLRRLRSPLRGFDLVLLDPPYAVESLDAVLGCACESVRPEGRIVLEHSRRRDAPPAIGEWQRARLLIAGDSALSFYERHA